MSDDAGGTKVFRQGKSTIITLYPEVYHKFVSTLHKEHPDLVGAMTLAKVKLDDGSAIEFLNQILMLTPPIGKNEPMELGFSRLLDALGQRTQSRINEEGAKRAAQEMNKENSNFDFKYRPEEDAGKPIFDDPKHLDTFGQ